MRRVRFHLSTAVVVTLVSGAFLGLNLNPQREVVSVGQYKAGKMAWTYFPGHIIDEDCYGWPAKMIRHDHADYNVTDADSWQYTWHEDEWFTRGVIVNFVFGMLLCFLTTFLLERPKRTPAAPIPEMETQSRKPLGSTP